MFDLVYDDGAMPDLRAAFPSGVFEDVSDPFHEGRFSVELPDEIRDQYVKVMIRKGWARVSLMIGIGMLNSRDSDGSILNIKTLQRLIAEMEVEFGKG